MTNFLRAVAFQLGRAELERILHGLHAAGHITDEESKELLRQIDSIKSEIVAAGQLDGRKRPPGRPRKDGTPAGESEGVDLGTLAAGQ
jgi:hypothetical protein